MNIPLTPLRCLRYAEQQFPQRTAIVCGSERFTYAQFAERAARLGGALLQLGIAPGDRVAFLSKNCHRLLEAYFGILEAGAVLLPLNFRLAAQELAFILNDSEARILFFEKEFLPFVEQFRRSVPSVERFVSLDSVPQADWISPRNYDQLLDAATPNQAEILQIDEDSLAELFYTSGTSADPKGVMLSHRNIYLHALSSSLVSDPRIEHVILHTIPLFHANGWGAAHTVTMLGGKHVILRLWDCGEMFRLIQQERVTHFGIVPTMAVAIVNSPERPKYDLSSLDRISIGGSASSPALVKEVEEKLGCTCYSGYGLTETSPVLSVSLSKPGAEWQGEQRWNGQAMTGYAIPGVELRVVDAEECDVPHDGASIGEVVARGDGVMQGYWKQPEATAQAMRGGWFHTGDMATMDKDGYILVVDRKKDIIISGGENISSLEIEKALSAHPAVYETAVVPVPDAKWGEVPKALVVLRPGASASEEQLLDFCRGRIAHYKCPRSVEFFASLPKTGTGKILKKDLRKQYWGHGTIRPELAETAQKRS